MPTSLGKMLLTVWICGEKIENLFSKACVLQIVFFFKKSNLRSLLSRREWQINMQGKQRHFFAYKSCYFLGFWLLPETVIMSTINLLWSFHFFLFVIRPIILGL